MKFVKKDEFITLSAANFFARYHHYLIGLIISTFLATFMSEIMLGWVIAGASAVTAASLIIMPKIFDRSGTRRVLVVFGLVEMCIVMGLSLAHTAGVAVILFALQGMCAYNMFLGLDLLLEAHTTDEKKTGHARGIFLVLANTAVFAASLSLSFILSDHNYADVFLIATASLAPFTMLAATLPSISRVQGAHTSFHHTIREIFERVSILPTVCAHFLLLVFFIWDLYYLPLYLYTHIGFEWKEIGLIMAITVLPYIIIEYPLGAFADSYVGEKEITFFGFIVMAIGIGLYSFIQTKTILPWLVIVLISNIGGAMVEVSTETHFFKRVAITDSDMISVFRMLRPFASILAPMIASLTLLFVPFQEIFMVFGAVLLLGIPLTVAMTDTR